MAVTVACCSFELVMEWSPSRVGTHTLALWEDPVHKYPELTHRAAVVQTISWFLLISFNNTHKNLREKSWLFVLFQAVSQAVTLLFGLLLSLQRDIQAASFLQSHLISGVSLSVFYPYLSFPKLYRMCFFKCNLLLCYPSTNQPRLLRSC